MAPHLGSRVSIPEAVVFREIKGESVLLHLETGEYYGLNEVGTRVWQLLAHATTLQGVLESLCVEYDVEERRLKADLLDLIAQLADKSLVKFDAK